MHVSRAGVVAGQYRAELKAPLVVGQQRATVAVAVLAVAVGLANGDRYTGQRGAVEAGDAAANIHSLAAVARLPEIDQARFAVAGTARIHLCE